MKKVLVVIAVILSIGVLGFFVFGEKQTSTATETTNEQAYVAIQSDIDNGAMLIDVRTTEEFEAGHVKDAVNIPVEDIQDGTMPETDKDTAIYVYCRSGNRSAQAKAVLEAAGYTNVEDLGGMDDVIAMGGEQA